MINSFAPPPPPPKEDQIGFENSFQFNSLISIHSTITQFDLQHSHNVGDLEVSMGHEWTQDAWHCENGLTAYNMIIVLPNVYIFLIMI